MIHDPQLRSCLISLWLCWWEYFLIVGWCWRAQPIVGSTILEHIHSQLLYKKGGWAIDTKPVSSINSWSLFHFFSFLVPTMISVLTSLNQGLYPANKLTGSSPKCYWSHYLYQQHNYLPVMQLENTLGGISVKQSIIKSCEYTLWIVENIHCVHVYTGWVFQRLKT